MGSPVNLLIVSEYPIVRLGVTSCLNGCTDVGSLVYAESLDQAVTALTGGSIDVVVIDLVILKPSGLSGIGTLLKHDPGIKIIVLSRHEKEPFITQCVEMGALGYVSLKSTAEELLEAVGTVSRNEKYLSRDVAYGYAISSLNKTTHAISSLTVREYQVFALLARGEAVTAIAKSLYISPKTVHVYRGNILSKLKIHNAFELTLLALKHGVISIEFFEQ